MLDLFFIIVLILAFILIAGGGNKNRLHQNHLSETQIRWRQQKQFMEESKHLSESEDKWEDALGQLTSEEIQRQRQIIEELEFIKQRIRPFNLYEWITHAISPELSKKYLLSSMWLFGAIIVVPWLLFGVTLTVVYTMSIIAFDFWMYYIHRFMEVTQWNSEYREKFGSGD